MKGNTFCKKLGNQNGATMIIALVFLMVISVIGGIVLTAANSSGNGLKDIREDEQGYMYLSSSCEVIKESVLGTTLQMNGTTAVTTSPILKYEIETSCTTASADKSVSFKVDLRKSTSSESELDGKLKVISGTLWIRLNYKDQYMTMKFRPTNTGTAYAWNQCEILRGADAYE